MVEDEVLLSQIMQRQASLDMHLHAMKSLKADVLALDKSDEVENVGIGEESVKKPEISADAGVKIVQTSEISIAEENVKKPEISAGAKVEIVSKVEPRKSKKKRRKRKRLLVNWMDVVLENKRNIKRRKRKKKKNEAKATN